MSDVSLTRIEERLMDIVNTVEIPIREARYDFPVRGMTVDTRENFIKFGSGFERYLLARGVAKGRLDPSALDEEFAGGLFVDHVNQSFSSMGGFPGAVTAAQSGMESGLQGVFTQVADAMVAEMSRKAVAFIFAEEVDESSYQEVQTIVRQLKGKEGLDGVASYALMLNWKELIMWRVQRKRMLKLRLWQKEEQRRDDNG